MQYAGHSRLPYPETLQAHGQKRTAYCRRSAYPAPLLTLIARVLTTEWVDYNGPRNAKGIVDAVVDRIPNHVQRITDPKLYEFLTQNNESVKAILFTPKATTSPLYRALAIDFRGRIEFAQIRDKEEEAVEVFGIESFPSLVVLPGGDKPGVVYEGNLSSLVWA